MNEAQIKNLLEKDLQEIEDFGFEIKKELLPLLELGRLIGELENHLLKERNKFIQQKLNWPEITFAKPSESKPMSEKERKSWDEQLESLRLSLEERKQKDPQSWKEMQQQWKESDAKIDADVELACQEFNQTYKPDLECLSISKGHLQERIQKFLQNQDSDRVAVLNLPSVQMAVVKWTQPLGQI